MRRVTLAFLLLLTFALTLAARPATAAPDTGLAQIGGQLTHWLAGWWPTGASNVSTTPSARHERRAGRFPLVECGGAIDPSGHCQTPPLKCGMTIDPSSQCTH
jgi:hypothetical protein